MWTTWMKLQKKIVVCIYNNHWAVIIEQFSIKCHKTKTKVITLFDWLFTTDANSPINQSELVVNTFCWCQVRENECDQDMLLGLSSELLPTELQMQLGGVVQIKGLKSLLSTTLKWKNFCILILAQALMGTRVNASFKNFNLRTNFLASRRKLFIGCIKAILLQPCAHGHTKSNNTENNLRLHTAFFKSTPVQLN